MIKQATYRSNSRKATVTVEHIDTWVSTTEHVVNFPRVVELEGDRLLLRYSRGHHGGEIGPTALVSDDLGATWHEPPPDLDIVDLDSGLFRPRSGGGSIGYMRDSTITYINLLTEASKEWRGTRLDGGPHPIKFRETDPTFRLRRFTKSGTLIEEHPFKLAGIPFPEASYQTYGRILELDGGDWLASFCADKKPPSETSEVTPSGRPRYDFRFGNLIVRSSDAGATWRVMTFIDPDELNPRYALDDRDVEEGLDESCLAQLANGDIYLIMRSGSHSPMYACRSHDGGETWSNLEPVGWPAARPDLQLLPNGVLACASGRGFYGHPQITHVMFSLDGTGYHWEYPFAFHTGPGCSYTQTMQRDGKLHVIYSDSDFTQELGFHSLPEQTIKRAVIDVTIDTIS